MANKAQLGMDAGFGIELAMFGSDVHYKPVCEYMTDLQTFPVRADDIFLCTYPRSGTHMTWEIISMIVKGKAEYSSQWTEHAHLDWRPQDYFESFASPRVIFSHHKPQSGPTCYIMLKANDCSKIDLETGPMCPSAQILDRFNVVISALTQSFLPKGIFEKRCHVIYVTRNLKDAVTSRYCQKSREFVPNMSGFSGSWEDFLELHLTGCAPYGDIFEYVEAWNNFPKDYPEVPYCHLRFEDIKKDQVKAVRHLADFLERPLEEDVCQEIADACSFVNLRRAYDTEKDKTCFYGSAHFRKGVSGDWKNWFTVAQSERFNQLYLEKLKESFPY